MRRSRARFLLGLIGSDDRDTLPMKRWIALGLLCAASAAQAANATVDPFDSAPWVELAAQYLPDGRVVYDERVIVTVPKFAEDAMNVPVTVDASALPDVERVVVIVDRNPIQRVLEFRPLHARPVLSFRFKLQQGSPVRAAARTRDGVWHVGSAWVDASGGGCTLPGATRAAGTWPQTLNQVQGRLFDRDHGGRLRLRVMHPMDTGLVAGIPAFHLERLTLTDTAGTEFMQMDLYEPVSENPVFSFDLGVDPQGSLVLSGRDNNGNRVHAQIAP